MAKKSDVEELKKKKPGDEDDFDLDFDFDDELSFGQDDKTAEAIRSRSNVKPSKREVVTNALKGSLEGAKSAVLNEDNLRTLVTSALPQEYDVILGKASTVSAGLNQVYGDAVKELKPGVKKLTSVLDKMSSEENARSKKISAKIKSIFNIEDGTPIVSKEQQEQQTIDNSLNAIFSKMAEHQAQQQAQQQARTEVREDVDRQVETNRFKSEYATLQNIDKNISLTTQYELQVTQEYHKKSLELQYRSYFVQAELLAKNKEQFEVIKIQNDAIVKNTALPEYAKLKNSERFMEIGRNKFMDKIQNSMFSESSVLKKGFDRLGKTVTGKIRDLTQSFITGIEMAEDIQEAIRNQQENAQQFEEMGMERTASDSKEYFAASALASGLLKNRANQQIAKFGNKIRRTWAPEGSAIDKLGKNLVGYANNMQGGAYDLANSDMLNPDKDTTSIGWFKEIARDVLMGFAKQDTDYELAGTGGIGKVTDYAQFDNRVYTSITDIIPGYLARILAQTEAIAKSKDLKVNDKDLLRFDYNEREFITKDEATQRIKKDFQETSNSQQVNTGLAKLIESLELGNTLKPEQLEYFKEAILTWLLAGNPVTLRVLASDEFNRQLPKSIRNKIQTAMQSLLERSKEKSKVDDKYHVGSYVNTQAIGLQKAIPDVRGKYQGYENAGFSDILQELGLVKRKQSKSYIQTDAYSRIIGGKKNYTKAGGITRDAAGMVSYDNDEYNKIIEDSKKATSDIHAKENIKPFGKSVLDRINKIKNYVWNYKDRQKGEESRMGPMAQDVQANLGNDAAPGGTSIDLVTMNGYTIEAIQELNDKIDQQGENKDLNELIKAIQHNTYFTATKLDEIHNKLFAGLSFNPSDNFAKLGVFARLHFDKARGKVIETIDNLKKDWQAASAEVDAQRAENPENPEGEEQKISLSERLFRFANSQSKGFAGASSRVIAGLLGAGVRLTEKTYAGVTGFFDITNNKVAKPVINFISERIEKNKEGLGEAFDKLIKGTWNLAGNVLKTTNKFFFDFIPQSIKNAHQLGKNLLNFGLDMIDTPTDIYVGNEPSARMTAHAMRLGVYIDQASMKPIRRPGDIKGPVIDMEGNTILTIDDLEKGLFDKQGNQIKSIKWRIVDFLKSKFDKSKELSKKLFSWGKRKGKKILDSAKSATSGIIDGRGYQKYIYNVLLDIRDILYSERRKKTPLNMRSEKDEKEIKTLGEKSKIAFKAVKDQAKKGFKYAKETIEGTEEKTPLLERLKNFGKAKKEKGLAYINDKQKALTNKVNEQLDQHPDLKNRLQGIKDETKYRGKNVIDTLSEKKSSFLSWFGKKKDELKEKKENWPEEKEKLKEELAKKKEELKKLAEEKKQTWSEKLKVKKEEVTGNWKNRFKLLEERRLQRQKEKEDELADDEKGPKYRGRNVIDVMYDKIMGIKDSISERLNQGKEVLDNIPDINGPDGHPDRRNRRGRWWRRGRPNPGNVAKKGLVSRGLGAAARGVGWGLRGALSLAGMGIMGTAKAATLASTATAAAATSTGTAVGSALGLAGTGLLASPAVPFLIGAAALAAGGYGLYKGYKYLTRNKASDLTKIRLNQYGLTPEQSSYFHYIFELEEYLEKEATVFNNGQAALNKSKINGEKILDIFGIDAKDENDLSRMEAFTTWFNGRFVHIYLAHKTLMHLLMSKGSLADIDDLNKDNLAYYLQNIKDNPSLYEITASPFEDIEQLSSTPAVTKELIDKIHKEKKVNKKMFADETTDSNQGKRVFKADNVEDINAGQSSNKSTAFDIAKTVAKGSIATWGIYSIAKVGLAKTALTAFNFALNPLSKSFALRLLAGAVFNPVGLTVLGVGAATYALYKGYKYFSRNRLTDIVKLRLVQYGLTPDFEKHYDKIFALEKLLAEKALIKSKDTIFMDEAKIPGEQVLEIFEIDLTTDKGQVQVKSFKNWFYGRFIPVFLKHRQALYNIDRDLELYEVYELEKENLRHYLNKVQVPDNIYDVKDSPFIDFEKLTGNKFDATNLTQEIEAKLPAKVLKETTEAKKLLEPKPASTGNQANQKPYTSPPISQEAKQNLDQLQGTNKNIAGQKNPIADDGEAGQKLAVPMTGITGKNTIGKIPVDSTPLKDGSQGDQYLVYQKGVNVDQLNPLLLQRFKAMVQEYGEKTGQKTIVTDGFRTYEEQAALYQKNPGKAARPGRSMHEFGLALDVDSKALNAMEELGLMRKYGFTRPIGGEAWHTEPAGVQMNIDKAKKDPNYAQQMILASAYRGGGGYGTIPNSILGKRNPDVALAVLQEGGTAPTLSDKDTAIATLEQKTLPQSQPASTGQPIYSDSGYQRVKQSSNTEGGLMPAMYYGENKPETQKTYSDINPQQEDNVYYYDFKNKKPAAGQGGYAGNIPHNSMGIEGQSHQNQRYGQVENEFQPGIRSQAQQLSADTSNVEGIKKMIHEVASMTGVDPATMQAMAAIESGFKPQAQSKLSSAGGLFQFIDGTWRDMLKKYGSKYGLGPDTPKTDAKANALMAAEYIKENTRALQKVKANVGAGDIYTAHFMGAGGASALYRANDQDIAARLFPKQAAVNKSIFYEGNRPRTVGELKQYLSQLVTKKASAYGIQLPASTEVAQAPKAPTSAPIQNAAPAESGLMKVSAQVPIYEDKVMTKPMQPAIGTPSGGILEDLTRSKPRQSPTQGRPLNIDQGNAFNMQSMTEGLGGINNILSQSLSVQQQMLSTLTQIASKISPEQFAQIMKQLQQPAPSKEAPAANNSQQPNISKDFPKEMPIPLDRKAYRI